MRASNTSQEFSARLPGNKQKFLSPRDTKILVLYLKVSYQIWTNETVVESFEFIANIVVSSLSDNIFQASHHVINETLMNTLVTQFQLATITRRIL